MKPVPAILAVLCVAAACAYEVQKPSAAPTAPPAPLMSVSGATGSTRGSTVCTAYVRDRALVKASLEELPEKGATEKEAAFARLTRKLESLDALIKDTCN